MRTHPMTCGRCGAEMATAYCQACSSPASDGSVDDIALEIEKLQPASGDIIVLYYPIATNHERLADMARSFAKGSGHITVLLPKEWKAAALSPENLEQMANQMLAMASAARN